ncbi:chemotaxis protein CheW [Paucibacter sp. APW11]|uniref:Chemotaxis protein CheW n=1 Tax=Roseateles aquae TaxID=3077235 RepID=A0ABU3PF24_9BURK|nr:chemotaxis protein CheW [Paucibacter sp. APW11]MDT9001180.1 chemotaxis protein CheW [Paucibacter sp. APW11]
MANKQALRDLQHRLAQRMQAARETTQTVQWLAVECAGQALLFPLKQAAEIFAPVPLKAVPYAKPWMLGVANLRGGLHTVIDLAMFLGLRETGNRLEAQQARLVALNAELNINCALQVDKLLGLRGDEHFQPDTGESSGPRPRFAGARLLDQQGRRWQVLDLEALSRHEQFLRIVD